MHIKKSTSFVYQLVCSYFVVYFGFLVEIIMNQSATERPFTVKVSKAILFHSILVFTIIYFHSDYNCNKGVKML